MPGTGIQSLNRPGTLTSLITSTFPTGGRVPRERWHAQTHARGLAAADSSWQALSPRPQSLPHPCSPARKRPDHQVHTFSPSPPPVQTHTPPAASAASRMGLGVMQPEFPDGFMPWLVTKEDSSSFHGRPGGYRVGCRAQVQPSRGRSWLSLGTHLETSPNLSPRSHCVHAEPK